MAWSEYLSDAELAEWQEELARFNERDAIGVDPEWEGDGQMPPLPLPVDDWRTYDSTRIFLEEFPNSPLVVPAFDIGPGRPSGLWGTAGGGKNITIQAIALAIAAGTEAFGKFACKRGRVLHISYDMGAVATALRYRQLAVGMNLMPSELNDRIELCVHPQFNLKSKDAAKEFAARMNGFDLCILDNLRAATPGADENESDFSKYLDQFGTAGSVASCTPLYLHHTRKGEDSLDTTSGRGTGAILAASGCIWGIEGEGSEPRKLKHLRPHDCGLGLRDSVWLQLQEFPTPPDTFNTGPHPSFRLTASETMPKPEKKGPELVAKVYAIITKNPGINQSDLYEACKPCRKETLVEIINNLLNTSRIVDSSDGSRNTARKYYLPSDLAGK